MSKWGNWIAIAGAMIVCVGPAAAARAAARQAEPKVNVCHVPPGNPANFHTIVISQNALAAHLAHGDNVGSCDNLCAILCDDGDACTIDDTGDCEQQGCPAAPRQAVNCDDERECTIDACDPASGCTNTPNAGAACDDGLVCTGPDACTSDGNCQGLQIPDCCLSNEDCSPSPCQRETCNATNRCEADPVVCTPPDECTVSACDEMTGDCAETPVLCDAGEECDLDDGQCKNLSGCSDGEREGFVDQTTHPAIAGCSGGWSLPGMLIPQSGALCTAAGDDSVNPSGTDCGAADLCATGWQVCQSAADVAAHSSTGCGSATEAGDPPLFFSSRQSGPGNGFCGAGSNDIFGCGNIGATPQANCSPLTRFSHDLCSAIPRPPWSCGVNGTLEATVVVKTDSTAGGVLCCRD